MVSYICVCGLFINAGIMWCKWHQVSVPSLLDQAALPPPLSPLAAPGPVVDPLFVADVTE